MLFTTYSKFNEAEYATIPDDFFANRVEKMELSRKENYLWYSMRHADAYAISFCAGRSHIKKRMQMGISDEEIWSEINSIYRPYEMAKFNKDARLYAFWFGPQAEGETTRKVFIRFYDSDRIFCFSIIGNPDQFYLEASARTKTSESKLFKNNNEAINFLVKYPDTFKYNLTDGLAYLNDDSGIISPVKSNKCVRTAFMILPVVHKLPGDSLSDKSVGVTLSHRFTDRILPIK